MSNILPLSIRRENFTEMEDAELSVNFFIFTEMNFLHLVMSCQLHGDKTVKGFVMSLVFVHGNINLSQQLIFAKMSSM